MLGFLVALPVVLGCECAVRAECAMEQAVFGAWLGSFGGVTSSTAAVSSSCLRVVEGGV